MKKTTLALVVLAISGWTFADTLETARWQAEIDAAAAKGGGRVVVGPGIHPVGTLWLRSNVELHLAEGAVLLASADKADYNALDAYPENSSCPIENWVGRHLIIAHSVTNVALTGKGVIDGNGEAFFEERVWFVGVYGRRDKMRGDEPTSTGEPFAVWRYGIRWSKAWDDPRPGQMVQFIKCRDVRVEGVKLRNAPCWNLHIWGCDRAHVSDVTVRASRSAANTDGIDIDCSADVTVERCDIDVGDDGVTFRGAEKRLGIVKPCERVTVRDCSIAACSSPFRLGVGTGLVRDILIENVRVWRGGGVLTYSCAYENRGGCDVENVTVRNLVAEGCFAAEVGRNDPLGPDNRFGVRNIKIENCDFARSPAGYGVVANGRNVRLHKVREAIRPDEGSWAGIQRSHTETAEAAFASVVSAGPVAFAVTLPKGASATNPTVRAKDGSFAVVREGDVCRFTVPGPGEYVFEPDATRRHALSLFVNAPRTWNEKWTRSFGPGEHFVGTLRLKDGDRIFLDENAVVYGGIVGENVKDVKICGWGVIDTGCYGRFGLSPETSREKSLSNLAFYGCTDVTVEGPVCVDAAYRCIRTENCERVTFDNVKTAGQWRYDAGTSGAR